MEISDPVLGVLSKDQDAESYVGKVRFAGQLIELRIEPDGTDLADCLKLAREFSLSLAEFDEKAKATAAKSLLSSYNENWRFGTEVDAEGQYVDFEKPSLSEEQFKRTIDLVSAGVVGDMIELCYSDADLFWGHSIFVNAFDGLSFRDVNVQLFG